MTGLGRTPRTLRCRLRVRVPPPTVARALGLKARERTVVVERLRSLDGDPFCLMHNELPLVLVPGLAEEGLHEESLYRRLEARYGLVPQRADEEVEARLATPIERRALGSDASTVLVVRRHTWLGDGRPLEVADMIASARRYRYRVGIVREGGR
jgi:GntR family transcriptional regulator